MQDLPWCFSTPSKRFQSQIIPSTPRNFQPILSKTPSAVCPPSPNLSTAKHFLASTQRPSPIPHPRNSPIINSQQLQPVAGSRRRRAKTSLFLFPATQVFHKREFWPLLVTQEDHNMVNEGQMLWPGIF
ncbi:hypothetical protein O181_065269 [Austropuccinia psidii MF-1]|uniref:Uncharacterized protein n=1 Tax=Austropuccinia psidii MF-1 TaxID=1389203 RepID=A0A9Q3EQR2_9BASI|nr:hypothetical protein [Austropuccinia psidii MF-1]